MAKQAHTALTRRGFLRASGVLSSGVLLAGLEKFDRLLGHRATIARIKEGQSLAEIRKSWSADLEEFQKRRERHLLYK